MTLKNAAVVFLTSLLALPMSYVLNTVSTLKDQSFIFLCGLFAYFLIGLICWLVIRERQQKVNTFYYVLSFMTYSSVMSLIIALGNDGLVAEFMGAYLREGEPYLKTAHGTMISYWDGIAHYALYLSMLAALSWNQSYHDVGLYWAGSYTYSQLVLALTIIIGKDGLRWPFLLHTPLMVLCIISCGSFVNRKYEEIQHMRSELAQAPETGKTSHPSIWRRPFHLFLVMYFIFAIVCIGIRFSGALQGNFSLVNEYRNSVEPYLTDPSNCSRAQLMVQAFYFIPYYMVNIYALIYPGQSWLLPWCLIFAGASGQAQISMIGASFHYRTPYLFRLPQTMFARCVFWFVNGLQLVVPQYMAFSLASDPSFYLKPLTPASPSKAATATGGVTNNSNGLHESFGYGSRRGSTISQHSMRLKKSD